MRPRVWQGRRPLGHEAVFQGPHLVRRRARHAPPSGHRDGLEKHKPPWPGAVGAWGGVVERGNRVVLHPGRLGEPGRRRRLVGRDETRVPAQAVARGKRRGAGWVGLVLGRFGGSARAQQPGFFRQFHPAHRKHFQRLHRRLQLGKAQPLVVRVGHVRGEAFLGVGTWNVPIRVRAVQTSTLRTRISTNNADLGNAHSEYLGPLAEQGILGLWPSSAC